MSIRTSISFGACLFILLYQVGHGIEHKNITYVYINLPPYENITKDHWTFQKGLGEDDKTLHGIISRSINYNSRKYCPSYKFQPHKVETYREMKKLLKVSSVEEMNNKHNISGEHFIFGPIPVSAFIYYNMHYLPEQFTFVTHFVYSQGLVELRRSSDVSLWNRVNNALSKSYLILVFLLLCALIVAAIMWVFDREWNPRAKKVSSLIFSIQPIQGVFYLRWLGLVQNYPKL